MLTGFTGAQETAYSNFGPGHDGWDYNYGLGWTLSGDSVPEQYGVQQAMGFTSGLNGFVTDIWLAISAVPSSSYPDTVTIRLCTNPDGQAPSEENILEEWTVTGFHSWSQWNTPIHLVAGNISEIHAGADYWLWAMATDLTWTMWCMNENSSLTCPHTLRREGEDWLSISQETASVFRVDVSTGVGISNVRQEERYASLGQNYPNPCSMHTTIPYSVVQAAQVNIEVFDVTGHKVRTLVDAFRAAGNHQVSFNTADLQPGMYICRMQAGEDPAGIIRINCMP